MGSQKEENSGFGLALAAAADHVDRLLGASTPKQAMELAAELLLAASNAQGVQVFEKNKEGELEEQWAAGQLEGDETERQAMAETAMDLGRPVFGDELTALPVAAGNMSLVVVAEKGIALDKDAGGLLSTIGSKGLEASLARAEAENQKQLRLAISRHICPTLTVTLARDDSEDVLSPEERPVSLLAVTIDGLSTEVDLIGPQRLLPVVHDFFSTVTDAVYEHEGAIVGLSLDHITAIFGAPIQADEPTQADLAAACGLRLLDGLKTLAEKWGIEGLPIHMEPKAGVASGPAMVGAFGTKERPVFSVVGAHVALTRELAKQGEPFDMVVDSATRSLLGERLSTRSLGAVEVQGLDYPVFAYAATRP